MVKRLARTARMLLVSGTLGLAGLSATADANMKPINQCELDVHAWCAAHTMAYGADYAMAYQACVTWEMYMRCRWTQEGGWE
ncbi:MAG TPA: hypothetical protein VE053_13085 [Allosphingosinicella sp.]|nr:hypothetical protein [Allosphingosinicella sp.]